MEPKDLKNSEEFKRPLSDDSELNSEANLNAVSSDTDVVDSDIVNEPIPEEEDEPSGAEAVMKTLKEASAIAEETDPVNEAIPEVTELVNAKIAEVPVETVDEAVAIHEENEGQPKQPANDIVVSASDEDAGASESVAMETPDRIEKKSEDIIEVLPEDAEVEVDQEESKMTDEEPATVAEVDEEETQATDAEPEAVAEVDQEETQATDAEPEAAAEVDQEETQATDAEPEAVTEVDEEETQATDAEPEAVAEVDEEETQATDAEPEAVAEVDEEEIQATDAEPAAVAEVDEEEIQATDAEPAAVAPDAAGLPQSLKVKEPASSQRDVPAEATAEEPSQDENEVDYDESEESDQVDYRHFSQIELINIFRELLDSGEIRDRTLNLIVGAFNLKVKENIAENKKQFVAEGGNEEDFVAEEDPYENDIKELVKKHRQTRFEQSKRMEAEKEINLQKKYTIIEDIKNLLNTEESINRTFQEFRDLQRQWYELGPVPQSRMKDLWDTYHFHVENFYDYIKINKELRDLDLKKNLEIKMSLCEKAEELLVEPSVIRAFNTLQKYHEQWREVGPVPRDKKDDIWERFKAVTTGINQKHQEFFEKRKGEQKRNLDAKVALCEKVEEIYSMQIDTHREWDEKSKQLIELQKVWRTIGFAPKRDNNKIYDRFRNACDQFFNKKRDFYSQNKELQNKNMQMKIDLCMEAEALKESDDWKKTTQQFIDIQKRWKDIGPVPRKHSDLLWKRFRAACDYFFDRKSVHFSDIDEEQFENMNLKKALIEEVENFVPDNDVNLSLKVLREFQRRWTEIGHVPIRDKDAVQNHFRAAVNKHFDTLKLDNSKRDSLNFRSKISNMTENQRGLSKVRQEREKYMVKLKQLETDLTLLDNNIGFFANSKNAQSLIADVNQKIADTREKIEMLKDKIRIIDDLDRTEY